MPCERQILQVEVLCLDRKSFKALLGPLEDIIRRNTTRWERAPPAVVVYAFYPAELRAKIAQDVQKALQATRDKRLATRSRD